MSVSCARASGRAKSQGEDRGAYQQTLEPRAPPRQPEGAEGHAGEQWALASHREVRVRITRVSIAAARALSCGDTTERARFATSWKRLSDAPRVSLGSWLVRPTDHRSIWLEIDVRLADRHAAGNISAARIGPRPALHDARSRCRRRVGSARERVCSRRSSFSPREPPPPPSRTRASASSPAIDA